MTATRRPVIAGVLKVGGSLFDLAEWPTRLLAWLATESRNAATTRAATAKRRPSLKSVFREQTWLLVAGGGPWIDTLRAWDARQSLGEEACHHWCVRLLSVTADVALHRLLAASKHDRAVRGPRRSDRAAHDPASGHGLERDESMFDVKVAPRVLPFAGIADLQGSWTAAVEPIGVHAASGVNSDSGINPGSGASATVSLMVVDAGSYLEFAASGRRGRLPRDWTVSSDSLAAHLAARVRARSLVLVKSCPLPGTVASAAEAASAGLVDPYFPQAAARLGSIKWLDLRAVRPTPIALREPRA